MNCLSPMHRSKVSYSNKLFGSLGVEYWILFVIWCLELRALASEQSGLFPKMTLIKAFSDL